MGRVMKKNIWRIIFISTIALCSSAQSFATWQGPIEVVSLRWGGQSGEVSIKKGDTEDTFPTNIAVGQNRIVIPDKGNGRAYIFSLNGELIQIFEPIKYRYTMVYDPRFIADYILLKAKDDYMLYDFMGELVQSFKGAIYIKELAIFGESIFVYDFKNQKYYQYSTKGELIKTYTKRPIEMGVVERKSLGDGKKQVSIEYPGKQYIVSPKYYHSADDDYLCDQIGNLYAVQRIVEKMNRYNPDEKILQHYRVTMFDRCNENPDILDLPTNEYEVVGRDDVVGDIKKALAEYGQPVISPVGDVYTWKRTPEAYSILRWIWIEGPDSPSSLRASSSKTNLSLSWVAPDQDANEVTEYEIVRSTDVCGPFNVIGKVEKNVFVYIDNEINADETYYYQVRAIRDKEYSGYSNKAVGKL